MVNNNKFLFRTIAVTLVALALMALFPVGVLTAPLFFLVNMVVIGLLEAHSEGSKYLPPVDQKLLTSSLSHSPPVSTAKVKRVVTCSSGCCQYEI